MKDVSPVSNNSNEQIVNLLSELVNLYKLVNKPTIVQRLEEELADPKRKQIYELSNGERSSREIAKIVGDVSYSTITVYWKQWAQKGLMTPAQRVGRYKHTVDLKEYGLDSYDPEKE
jgi:DNA-binding transcriptional ArsR family regulator